MFATAAAANELSQDEPSPRVLAWLDDSAVGDAASRRPAHRRVRIAT